MVRKALPFPTVLTTSDHPRLTASAESAWNAFVASASFAEGFGGSRLRGLIGVLNRQPRGLPRFPASRDGELWRAVALVNLGIAWSFLAPLMSLTRYNQ
jgi:hypothetical protein